MKRKLVRILKGCVITTEIGTQQFFKAGDITNLISETATDLISGGYASEINTGKAQKQKTKVKPVETTDLKKEKLETPETPKEAE